MFNFSAVAAGDEMVLRYFTATSLISEEKF